MSLAAKSSNYNNGSEEKSTVQLVCQPSDNSENQRNTDKSIVSKDSDNFDHYQWTINDTSNLTEFERVFQNKKNVNVHLKRLDLIQMQKVILNDSTKSMGQNLTGFSQATKKTGEKMQVKAPSFETLVDFGNVHDQTIIEELQE